MGVNKGSGTVFKWFSHMTAMAGLLTWFGICVTYIRFHKGFTMQRLDRAILPYSSRLQPYAAWYGAIWTITIAIVREPVAHCLSSAYRAPTVQRMDSVPQRQMGPCRIRNEIFANGHVPCPVSNHQVRVQSDAYQAH
jgi:hypothetical protein